MTIIKKYQEVIQSPGTHSKGELEFVLEALKLFYNSSVVWEKVFGFQPHQGVPSNFVLSHIESLIKNRDLKE